MQRRLHGRGRGVSALASGKQHVPCDGGRKGRPLLGTRSWSCRQRATCRLMIANNQRGRDRRLRQGLKERRGQGGAGRRLLFIDVALREWAVVRNADHAHWRRMYVRRISVCRPRPYRQPVVVVGMVPCLGPDQPSARCTQHYWRLARASPSISISQRSPTPQWNNPSASTMLVELCVGPGKWQVRGTPCARM